MTKFNSTMVPRSRKTRKSSKCLETVLLRLSITGFHLLAKNFILSYNILALPRTEDFLFAPNKLSAKEKECLASGDGKMILIVDNYDSFTYNLIQYIGELLLADFGAKSQEALEQMLQVYRNDKISPAEMEALKLSHIIISPGPCTPNEAGISMDVVRHFAGNIPILGVCLGHQAIGQAFGGRIVRTMPVHGKTSLIHHDGKTIFEGVENPLTATRYHSLIIERDSLPPVLEISAQTEDGLIMGVRHKEARVEGVQFHPESILTAEGKKILRNFLKIGAGRSETTAPTL